MKLSFSQGGPVEVPLLFHGVTFCRNGPSYCPANPKQKLLSHQKPAGRTSIEMEMKSNVAPMSCLVDQEHLRPPSVCILIKPRNSAPKNKILISIFMVLFLTEPFYESGLSA
ncbi:hypothetical protein ILYODFUR_028809 [Ilyodon furcidens]|uniref:Uncharacterized protein n=1 Tax=Ilyodon furcidens TaxID=33524 RepID=A0ABV0VL02_9TELE